MIRSVIAAAMSAAFILSFAGCGKSSNVSTQSAGNTTNASSASGPTLVKAGTVYYGKLKQEISSKKSHDGDTFVLVQTDTLLHKDPSLHGSSIDGHLENVTPAGMGKKPGMVIVFDDVKMPDGTKGPVNVQLLSANQFDAKTHHWRTIGLMVGGAVACLMAGSAAHTKNGSLVGAAGGYALSQQMKTDIDVKPGTVVQLKFLNDANAQNGANAQSSAGAQ
jgi:hypothetical protein